MYSQKFVTLTTLTLDYRYIDNSDAMLEENIKFQINGS